MAIGIFDSGLGGLSVLKYVLEKYKDERIVYFADTLNFPYGTKSTEELIGYGRQIFDFFLENNVTEVIIACNTASATTVSYTHLTLPTKLEWCRSRWSPYH